VFQDVTNKLSYSPPPAKARRARPSKSLLPWHPDGEVDMFEWEETLEDDTTKG
jgi:hypothetical protein